MMTKTPLGRFPARKMALSLAVAIASQVLPAVAQDDDEVTASALEEVIVTGTKRDVQQQDLPIAVSTITAAQLYKVSLGFAPAYSGATVSCKTLFTFGAPAS